MLRSLREMLGYKVRAIDEDVGRVEDFYFDDFTWKIRYLVVDIGLWQAGRRVLISPIQLGEPDWTGMALPVAMTMAQIQDSPGIKEDLPVSLQEELVDVEKHVVWAPYWPPVGSSLAGIPLQATATDKRPETPATRSGDPRLRSVGEVVNYHIETAQGGAGHVEDVIAETDLWRIFYLVVDTRDWLPSKEVIVSPDWVSRIDWGEKRIAVDLSQEQIRNGPEYDPSLPVNREYETRVYDFYGRPKYWE